MKEITFALEIRALPTSAVVNPSALSIGAPRDPRGPGAAATMPSTRSAPRAALAGARAAALLTLLASAPAGASPEAPETLRLSLADALEAGLLRSYAMRLARADDETAAAQVRAAYAALFPKLDANASYQRTFLTPNPFAGSDAADLFTGVNTQDWLSYNERVRRGASGLDVDDVARACPAAVMGDMLQTIDFATYAACVGQAQDAVRLGDAPQPGDNPFLVENTFRAGLSASQLVYSGAAFSAVEAAETSGELSDAQLERTAQTVAGDIVRAYYGTLLARAGVEVLEKSVARSRETVKEVAARAKEGVVPRFELLSAEVELANLETELVSARDDAASAEEALALAIGVSVLAELVLTDRLALPESPPDPPSVPEAMAVALEERPDLAAARLTIELRRIQEDVTFARYLPELRLVANLSAVGNIPDDRSVVFSTPNSDAGVLLPQNPFAFEARERGVFDDAYWGTNFTAGLNLTWNLFEGFATAAQQRQDELETLKARIQAEQLAENVRREVAEERRNLASALERVAVQAKNVERAELNYRHAELRVEEGVSSQLELRDASQQLDQSRLNRLQAVHDYLVARASFEVALGRSPLARDGDSP